MTNTGGGQVTIIPAWVSKRDESGVWAVLGSEPSESAEEVFVPMSALESVVLSRDLIRDSADRVFGVLIYKKESPK